MTAHAPGGPRRPPSTAAGPPRGTILLVDTDDAARRAAKRAFESQGFKVIEARGGSHALRVCEYVRGQVDALITEVAIPEPNGVALAEAVTAWWPRAAILFMSDGVVAAVSRRLGGPRVRRVLARPLAAEELVETTCQALVAR